MTWIVIALRDESATIYHNYDEMLARVNLLKMHCIVYCGKECTLISQNGKLMAVQ